MIREKLLKFIPACDIIKSGLIVSIFALCTHFFNYTFQILMGRMLNPENFSKINVLFALIAIFGVPGIAISLTTSQYISSNLQTKNDGNISYFIGIGFQLVLVIGISFLLLSSLVTPLVENWLSISPIEFLLLIFYLLISFVYSFSIGIHQGFQDFYSFSIIPFIAALMKLLLGTTLVSFGFLVNGVMFALILSILAASIFSILKNISKTKLSLQTPYENNGKYQPFHIIHISRQFVMLFLAIFLCSLMMYSDVVIVRHFLSDETKGTFAALSTIGKIIFFIYYPFIQVMFPKVAAKSIAVSKKDTQSITQALLVLTLLLVFILPLFYFFPSTIFSVFFSSKYIHGSPYLFSYGVGVSLGVLSQLFIYFFVAKKAYRYFLLLSVCILLQPISIIFFHSNLSEVVSVILYTNLLTSLVAIGSYIVFLRYKNGAS